jgi:hypothetical protein
MGKFLFRERYLSKQKSQSHEIWCHEISRHDLQKLSKGRNRCNPYETPQNYFDINTYNNVEKMVKIIAI